MIKLSDIAISLKNDFGASGNGIDDDQIPFVAFSIIWQSMVVLA